MYQLNGILCFALMHHSNIECLQFQFDCIEVQVVKESEQKRRNQLVMITAMNN